MSGLVHPDRNVRNATQNSLCRAVNRRRGCCACRASNCRRRARFSRTRSSRERKTLTKQPRECRSDTRPSGQAPLLGPSPLRTVHASLPAQSSSTANASFRETRLRYGKMLAVNPVFLVCPKFLGPHQGFSCHHFPSLVERRELCRYTSWSAGVARLAPSPIGRPSLPSRYALGVGERCGEWPANQWHTTPPLRLRPHQRFLPSSSACLMCRFASFSRVKHLRTVGPLSRPVMWSLRLTQPVSAPLQSSLRFLPDLLSAPPSVHLAMYVPPVTGERYGLILFRWNDSIG